MNFENVSSEKILTQIRVHTPYFYLYEILEKRKEKIYL